MKAIEFTRGSKAAETNAHELKGQMGYVYMWDRLPKPVSVG